MDKNNKKQLIYRIGEYELNATIEQLFHSGERLNIEPQQFSLLLLLVENSSKIITREQIQTSVWAGRPATDESIRAAVKKLRDMLGDDARAPTFIKTIPKQGYKWLAPCEVLDSENAVKKTASKSIKLVTSITLAVMCSVFIFLYVIFSAPKRIPDPVNLAKIEQLTDLTGSEIFANYNASSNKLVFLHRENSNSPQQLYTKDLTSGEVKRLTWDKQHYTDSYWSPDGSQLVFTSGMVNEVQHYLVEFDEKQKVKRVEKLGLTSNSKKYVIGWQRDKSGLWLADERENSQPHSIYRYDFETNSITPVTFPNVAGRGDYYAAQSHSGEKLAILREVEKNQSSLIILDISSGDVNANYLIPFPANRLVWRFDDSGLIISNFFGQVATFDIANQGFVFDVELPVNAMDIYASCGDKCLILRQHNGDYLDLKEIPLSEFALKHKNDDTPRLYNTRILKQAGAQDLPRYIADTNGLVYASLDNNRLTIKAITDGKASRELVVFDELQGVSALTTSLDNQLAGIINSRLFLLDNIFNGAPAAPPTFISAALERIENPVWHTDNSHLFVTHYMGNTPTIIKINSKTHHRETVVAGFLSFRPSENEDEAIAIDPELNAWLLKKRNDTWHKVRKIAKVSSANVHRWHFVNGVFFYTKLEQRTGVLCKLDTKSSGQNQHVQCTEIGQNMFRLNFDINIKDSTLIMVESLSAQSDIIRLTW